MYEATVGRFCSRDPIGYVDGSNTYSYAKANILNLLDFPGLLSTKTQGSEDVDLKTAENEGCDDCCSCPKSIKVRVGKTQPGGTTNTKGEPYTTFLEYTVTMEYTEMDRSLFQWIAGGFDNKCKVAFAEFPQIPPGTLTSYAVNNI